MRVVVTGATGNVGTAVVEALGAHPAVESILGLARRPTDWKPPKTEIRSVDVSIDDLGPHVRGADVVVHAAWRFQPTHRPDVTWDNNARGSVRTFEAAARAGVGALVHLSSVGTYAPGPADAKAVDESWPTTASGAAAYGREKSYVERTLDGFEADGRFDRIVRLRPAFIFQRRAAVEQLHIFANRWIPRRAARVDLLPILPLPVGLRFQVVHATDVARAVVAAATGSTSGPFNLAADPVVDTELLGAVLGARVVTVPRRAAAAAVGAAWSARLIGASPGLVDLFLSLPLLDSGRARTELGWMPQHGAEQTLIDLVGGLVAADIGPTPPLGGGRWPVPAGPA